MSRDTVQKIIEQSAVKPYHGMWAAFCLREGVTKDAVFHWRKKLGLPLCGKIPGKVGYKRAYS